LNQPGAVVRQVLDQDITPSVSQEAEEGRRLLILGNVVADLNDAAVATAEELNLVTTGIFEEEPRSCESAPGQHRVQ